MQNALLTFVMSSHQNNSIMPRATKTTAPAAPLINFQVRLHAIGGGKCEFTGAALPTLEETITVPAADRRAAYRRAPVLMTLPLMGQELEIYIDGTRELGNH